MPVQIFWSRPKIELTFIPLQKVLCRHKNWIYYMKIIFWSGTKNLGLVQYVNQYLAWHKKFGPAQNVLGLVKGQGINHFDSYSLCRNGELDYNFKRFDLVWIHYGQCCLLCWIYGGLVKSWSSSGLFLLVICSSLLENSDNHLLVSFNLRHNANYNSSIICHLAFL